MKYTIDWLENKISKNGKQYIKATIKDETGKTDEVSIWPDFSYFADLKPGSTVEGVITIKGQYKNLTSGSHSVNPNYKSTQVEQAMQRKEASIDRFQTSKEENIKLSSSARDATLIVTTFYPELSKMEDVDLKDVAIKNKWQEWRKYFMGGFEGEPF